MNLADTMADRHASLTRPALVWEGRDGTRRTLGFADLAAASARHANLLRRHGVGPGDRVACIMPRVPESTVAMLGAFRLGAVHLPIFSGFGEAAVARRAADAGAKAVVTHAEVRDRVPERWDAPVAVLTVGGAGAPGDTACAAAVAAESEAFDPVPRRRDDPGCCSLPPVSPGRRRRWRSRRTSPPPYGRRSGLAATCGPRIPSGRRAILGWGYGLVLLWRSPWRSGITAHMWEANPQPSATLDFLARHRITSLATVPTLAARVDGAGGGGGAAAGPSPSVPLRAVASR